MKNKKYIFYCETTKDNRLSFPQNLLYSFLVYRSKKNNPPSINRIAENLGGNKRTIAKNLAILQSHHLADGTKALPPDAEHERWWRYKADADCWQDRFASFKLYLPTKALPLSHSAVISLIISLHKNENWVFSIGGLATMLFPALSQKSGKREMWRIVAELKERNLLNDWWDVKPDESLWRDAGFQQIESKLSDILPEEYEPVVFSSLDNLVASMDYCEDLMKKSNFARKQIHEHFQCVNKVPLDVMETYFLHFPKIFGWCEKITNENRINGKFSGASSIGLLTKKTADEFARMEAFAQRGLIRDYEPV